MKERFLRELCNKRIVVSNEGKDQVECLLYLAKQYGVVITSGEQYINKESMKSIVELIGHNVPAPFYRGFPESVKKLSNMQLLLDQLIHYTITYGLGVFDADGHSMFEQEIRRVALKEKVEPILFKVVTEEEAYVELEKIIANLCASTRPLNTDNLSLIKDWVDEGRALPEIASKNTRVNLAVSLRKNVGLSIFDVLDLAEILNSYQHANEYFSYKKYKLTNLHLSSANRKFITSILHEVLQNPISLNASKNIVEKKKYFKGLLHHIHFKPITKEELKFTDIIYKDVIKSYNSDMMRKLASAQVVTAAEVAANKSQGFLLRNLVFLLSRANSEKEMEAILNKIECKSPIILFQMLFGIKFDTEKTPRSFAWVKNNLGRSHKETSKEVESRRTILSQDTISLLYNTVRSKLFQYLALKGDDRKVYVAESMKNIAIPMQEAAGSNGLNALPRGSRIPLNGKSLRAFTYWSEVNDVDLAMYIIDKDGNFIDHVYFGNYHDARRKGITFSGDKTDGYNGAAEYFDVELSDVKAGYPKAKYLVFVDNVYSAKPFSSLKCTAGFMLREDLTKGEIFEPKTVKTSFHITADSTNAYLYALDLESEEMIWLNTARATNARVGDGQVDAVKKALEIVKLFNIYELYTTRYKNIVDKVEDADLIISDENIELRTGQTQIHSYDVDAFLAELNK